MFTTLLVRLLPVLLVSLAAQSFITTDRISPEAFEKISIGMNVKDVEFVLGSPAKISTTDTNIVSLGNPGGFVQGWVGESGSIRVEFSRNRTVVRVDCMFRLRRDLIQRLRDWIDW